MLNPDEAALRVYNYLHAMTLEAQLLARACGKTNIHSLEPEDMAALTMEASALAKVPLSGTNHTCLLYTSPSPRDVEESRMPSSA